MDDNNFVLDIKYPLSPLTGLAIALSSFDYTPN